MSRTIEKRILPRLESRKYRKRLDLQLNLPGLLAQLRFSFVLIGRGRLLTI